MTISSATFIEDTVIFLRNYLRSNVSDPLSRGSDNSSFIFTSFPKSNTQYPLITVKNNGNTIKRMGMQTATGWGSVKIEIRVYARNSKEVDSLTDSVINILKNSQFLTAGTVNNNIYNFQLTGMNYIVEDAGDNSIHSKIMSYVFNVVLT